MRRAKGIYPLLLITVFALMASFAFASISFDGGGIKYVPANKGDILFSVDYGASKMYFDNGFLMLNNLDGLFSSIGFSCDTVTANMTITKIESNEIDYTVNAATDVTSTTKIYVGSKGRPSDVSGATSWSYNNFLKVVTVNVLHQSPSNIILEWTDDDGVIPDDYKRRFFISYRILGLVFLLYPLSMLLGVLLMGKFEIGEMGAFIFVIIYVSIALMILVQILSI